MTERYDILTVREYTDRDGNKRSSWTRIGSMWPMKNGGFSATFDALPLPSMGERGLETRVVMKVPEPKGDAPRSQPRDSYAKASGGREKPAHTGGGDIEDEIPFAPEWR